MAILGALLVLSGCASRIEPFPKGGSAREGESRIAVFGVENLSGATAPVGEIRRALIDRLKTYGIDVLDDESLDKVLTKHRVRYTAGVEQGIAKVMREEAGTEGILIPSLEFYDGANPPKVALFGRLVSTGDSPAILWMDGIGLAGDDSPGILGLGLVEDPRALLAKAVDSLARSLAQHASAAGKTPGEKPGAAKFRPKIVYRAPAVDLHRKYTIAVVPFFNKSARKYAGEIIALHMMKHLTGFPSFEIVEPGIVRQELLKFRIIMNEGVSLADTETILNAVNADLVLNGEVMEYQDFRGADGKAKVGFSVLFIERKTRKVIYSSHSSNRGDDGVLVFDWGRINTAHAMASQMARAIGEGMLAEPRGTQASRVPTRDKAGPGQ